jgi:Holliday junction DNA helicase RuvA
MAIGMGDAKRISAIKGVGKKTAEKICLELGDKVSSFAVRTAVNESQKPIAADAIAALRALGFNEETSAKMVADALAKNASADTTEAIIRLALAGK